MKSLNNFSTVLFGMFLLSTTILAQLELSVYTDKTDYQYGEQIELFCKVTNNADTTFEFLAGSSGSCQAEFSFNNFNSWERTTCFTMSEMLTFKPHSSKIYSWKITPEKYGLPKNDGTQMIIGYYYFDLVDTTYINAPQYLGGQLSVGFLEGDSDSVQSIKDSLNVTVLNHHEYSWIINEQWQVEGFQIDSLINHFRKDSILTYIENSVMVEYDRIVDENPLDYYPLHVGDSWQYSVQEKQSEEEETTKLITVKVRGKEVVDGKEYFTLTNSETYCIQYFRIDSTDATIWELKNGSECMIDSLTMLPNSIGFTNQCFGSSECILDTTKVIFGVERGIKKFHYTDGTTCTFCIRGHYEYAENIGKTLKHIIYPAPDGFKAGYRIDSLVYAKIDDIEYGNYTQEGTNPNIDFYPLHVGDKWVYSWSIDNGTNKYVTTSKITHSEILSNGNEYFYREEDGASRYERIDSLNGFIYTYNDTAVATNYESFVFSLNANKDDTLIGQDGSHQVYSGRYDGSLFGKKTILFSYYVPEIRTYIETFGYGFGSIKRIHGLNQETTKTLLYAKIDGVEHGDMSYSDNNGVYLQDSTLYLFQNENSFGFADTTWLINISPEILMVDSVINNHGYSYTFNVLFSDSSSQVYSLLQNYIDTVAFIVNPYDSVRIILSNPDLCPICDGSGISAFTDSLNIFTNSENKPVLVLSIEGDGTLDVYNSNLDNYTFSLSQNYPNPFNPTTTISYSLPQSGFVQVNVYDILGRKVAILVNEVKNAGVYKVAFDARNFASGIYYYNMKSGSFVETKKMIILK